MDLHGVDKKEMELIVYVNGEKFKIPIESPEEYNPQQIREDEESGWDYAQGQAGFDA